MAEIDRTLLGAWGPESTMRVEVGKIREFARAVKDANPAYLADDDAALAPPTFLMTIAHWLRDLGATRSAVKLDYRRLLHGEQEFEYLAPIRAGDVLTFRSRTKDVFEKQGKRGGTLRFAVMVTEFRDADGRLVAEAKLTGVETEKPPEGTP
jgi:acyl dehydratase